MAVRHDAIFIAAARSTFEQCDSTRLDSFHEIYSIFQLESALGKLTFILDLHDIIVHTCACVYFLETQTRSSCVAFKTKMAARKKKVLMDFARDIELIASRSGSRV